MDVDDLARLQLEQEESKRRMKEEIRAITAPFSHWSAQEGPVWANVLPLFRDCPCGFTQYLIRSSPWMRFAPESRIGSPSCGIKRKAIREIQDLSY